MSPETVTEDPNLKEDINARIPVCTLLSHHTLMEKPFGPITPVAVYSCDWSNSWTSMNNSPSFCPSTQTQSLICVLSCSVPISIV